MYPGRKIPISKNIQETIPTYFKREKPHEFNFVNHNEFGPGSNKLLRLTSEVLFRLVLAAYFGMVD